MASSSKVPAAFAASLAAANQTSSLALHESYGSHANSSPLPLPHQSIGVAELGGTSISNSSTIASKSMQAVKGHRQELCADENVNLSNHNSARQRHAPMAHSTADGSNIDALAEVGHFQQDGGDIQRQAEFQWQASEDPQSTESAQSASMHSYSVDR